MIYKILRGIFKLMKYYTITKTDLKRFFNRDVEADVDYPSPADAFMLDMLQQMSPIQREQWIKQQAAQFITETDQAKQKKDFN